MGKEIKVGAVDESQNYLCSGRLVGKCWLVKLLDHLSWSYQVKLGSVPSSTSDIAEPSANCTSTTDYASSLLPNLTIGHFISGHFRG